MVDLVTDSEASALLAHLVQRLSSTVEQEEVDPACWSFPYYYQCSVDSMRPPQSAPAAVAAEHASFYPPPQQP